ncbi:MAG: hypothetical protein QXK06_00060, partial [Candidatus Diapherotrites archaeon]
MPLKENIEDLGFTISEGYASLKEKTRIPPIAIIAVLVIAIAAFFYFSQQPKPPITTPTVATVGATFIFRDNFENPINNLSVTITVDKNSMSRKTADGGKIALEVPEEAKIKISVNDPDYEAFEKTYSAGKKGLKEIITLKLLKIPPEKRVLRFEDEKGLIKGKKITAIIECKDGRSFTATDEDMDGIIEVELPQNCKEIKVRAEVPGYEALDTGSFSGSGTQTITLKKIERPKGSATINVVKEDGKPLTGVDFTIVLEKEGEKIPASSQGYASVHFPDLLTGTYDGTFIESTGEFVPVNPAELHGIVIQKGMSTEKTIKVSRTVKGTITVSVKDKETSQAIANAKVILSTQSGKLLDEKNTGENAEKVVFRLYEKGSYSITAKKEGKVNEGYFPATIDVNDLNTEITIELQMIKPELLGKAIVKVKDEDGLPVMDAKAMFRYKTTGAIVPLNGEKDYVLTNSEGIAEFQLGPIEKEIYAYALKYPAEGGKPENAKKIDPLKLNEFEVKISIGNSTLSIKTLDTSGTLLTETFFEAFDQSNVSVTQGKVPVPQGELEYSIKADKKIYLVFSKNGYMDFQTELFQLWPGEKFPITAIMRKPGEILQPEISFTGAFENGVKAESLKAGKTYEMKFMLSFPNNTELSSAGFHFRAGEKQTLKEEQIYISTVNAPNASSIKKGATYKPPKNEAFEEPAMDSAKWASIEWVKPASGVYNVSIEVRIKEATYPNSKLPVYYRAWSVKDTNFARTPQDAVLGGNAVSPSKDGLYAETFSQVFFEGSKPFCDKPFCIMGEWLYDKQEDIFKPKPYSMLVLGDYNYIFTLVNNSKETYNETRLLLKNEMAGEEKQDLMVKSFIFYNADKAFSSQNVNDFSFSLSSLGNFTYSKDINLNLSLFPKNTADTQFLVQLVGDKQVVFEEKIGFRITAKSELLLEATPSSIVPFEETILKIKAKSKDNGTNIKGVLVKATRETPDGLFQVFAKTTDNSGEATFQIPASTPLTKIKIEAEKTGFAPKKMEIIVGKETIDFKPKTLSSSLQTTGKTEETLPITFSNSTGTEFALKKATLKGNFKGILNEQAIATYLASWTNTKISAKTNQEIPLLKTVLSSNAEDYMKGTETLKGELEIIVWAPKFLAEYLISIPLTVSVSMGGLPDNSPCVNIEGIDVPNWQATTANNRASTEFDIYNVCSKNGQKINVKNLQAMLEWESDSKKAGTIELTIFNADGASVTEVLKAGEWITFWPEMGKDIFGSFHAILTFTPKTGYLNETAKFKVFFDAETMTDNGLQKVNNGKVKISASILSLNLDDCISMPGAGEKVVLGADKDETTFELDATNCKADVTVRLCPGDPKCKGGTQEGGIRVTPMEFTLTKTSPKQKITVYREQIPGLYGIPVQARLSSTSFRTVRTIDLLVEPEKSEWFALNRYEALLSKETDWKDTIELKNSAPMDLVEITAKFCDKCKDPQNPPKECVWNYVLKKKPEQRPERWAEALTWGLTTAVSCWCLLNLGTCVESGGAIISKILPFEAEEDYGQPIAYFSQKPTPETNKKEITANFLFPGPWDAIICGGVGIVVGVFTFLGGPECNEKKDVTEILRDYIVKVGNDPNRKLSLESNLFNAVWHDTNSNWETAGIEKVPITIVNTSKTAKTSPTYDVLSVSATEHIHNDPTHKKPKMIMETPNFSDLNIPDTETRKYEQKFHMKFTTKEMIDFELPPLEDFYSCVDGSKIGITGKDARPKIKFNWDWKENSGISATDCDATNKDGIYCDATQLSIAVSKRIHKIEEFLAANGNSLKCPNNPQTSYSSAVLEKINKEQSMHEVVNGKIGMKSISATANSDSGTVAISAIIENKSSNSATAKIIMGLSGPNNYFNHCQLEVTVPANGTTPAKCDFTGLEKNNFTPYISTAYIAESSASEIDDTEVKTGFFLSNPLQATECWLPFSTQKFQGYPVIEYFFNKSIPNWEQYLQQQSVNWPAGWPGATEQEKIAYLRSLFEFKANLIKDGYGADFQSDFAAYYSGSTFFDVPSWFYSGSSNQLSDYFRDPERLKFKQKYSSEAILPGPGTYEVYIVIDFGAGNWSLYKDGKPKGKITVEFYKASDPIVNSAFYYLPFNGQVGLQTQNGRQDYGLNYSNQNEEIPIKGAPYDVRTVPSSASKALMTLQTKKQQDLKQLNSSPSTRGNLLAIEIQGSNPLLSFSPSYATPVILKASGEKGKPFTSQFTLIENGQPVIAGNNLSFWTGLGKCADFSGVPIREAFDAFPDSRSTEKSYKISWDSIAYGGNLYLYSVFYTPLAGAYSITADSPNSYFMSPDSGEAKTIEVSGINGMKNNSRSGNDPVASIERILEM